MRCKETITGLLQFWNFSVNISRIEHLYIAMFNILRLTDLIKSRRHGALPRESGWKVGG